MKTTKLARLALAGLSFASITAFSTPAQAGIVILKNGNVFVGRIDAEDVKKDSKDGKEILVSVTLHDPKVFVGAPKANGRWAFEAKNIRWWDKDANEPTDEYMKDHADEVIDQRYSEFILKWKERQTEGSDPAVGIAIPFKFSSTTLSPIPTAGQGFTVKKPVGWNQKEVNDIVIFESTEKVDGVPARIVCFSLPRSATAASEQFKWVRDELKKTAASDAFEVTEGDNVPPKSVKNGYDMEWVTSTRRVLPTPRTIRALRQIRIREKRTYFFSCYAHEAMFDEKRFLFSACAKSLEIDEDNPTSGAGSADRIDTSGVKVGQVYRWKSSAVPDQVVWEITSTVGSTVGHKTTLAMPDGQKKVSDDVDQIGPLDPVARMTAVAAPGVNPQLVKQEQITVSNVTFDCNVYEAEANNKKYRLWLSKKFPVEVKLTIDGSIERQLDEVK